MLRNRINKLANASYLEFLDISDYIWKTPNFIKKEIELEIEKLNLYYPENKEDQGIRWNHESRKLFKTFPYLNSSSNLFSVASIFEVYLLRLGHEIEIHNDKKLCDTRGQGSARVFKYLRELYVQPEELELWMQVQSAIKIRNCLVHACGILAWSRDEVEIRNIHKNKLFLSKEDREHREKKEFNSDEVNILASDFGERLQINNMYPWLLSAYFRDFFVELCQLSLDKSDAK
jgi:hypothetical protein